MVGCAEKVGCRAGSVGCCGKVNAGVVGECGGWDAGCVGIEWAMEAVLCGSKAKDTASCSKLEAV